MIEVLSEEKVTQCKGVFNLFDKNKDGTIQTEDLVDVMKALDYNPEEGQIQEMIKLVDESHTGKIKFKEFLELFVRTQSDPETEEDIVELFKSHDLYGKASVTVAEFRLILTDLLSEEEIDEAVSDFGKSGTIDYRKYVKSLIK